MKRIIPACILAVVIISSCIVGQIVVKKYCDGVYNDLKECKEQFVNGEISTAYNLSVEVKENWTGNKAVLSVFVNHNLLDEISQSVMQLPEFAKTDGKDTFLGECSKIQSMLTLIKEEQRIRGESFY